MQGRKAQATTWSLFLTPLLVFSVGCFVDVALNTAVAGGRLNMFLPEVCGLTVGALTVLTFSRRRSAYLLAATIFTVTEMAAVLLPMQSAMRIAVCGACVVMTALCVMIFAYVPWASVEPFEAESHPNRF